MVSMMTWTGWAVGMTSTCSSSFVLPSFFQSPLYFFITFYNDLYLPFSLFVLYDCCCLCSLHCLGSLSGVLICWAFFSFDIFYTRLHHISTVLRTHFAIPFSPPIPSRLPTRHHCRLRHAYTFFLYIFYYISCFFCLLTLLRLGVSLMTIACTLQLCFIWHDIFTQQGEVRAGSQPGATCEYIKYLP